MATIDDIGEVNEPLSAPALGGPTGWAAAVRDYIRDLPAQISGKVDRSGDTMTGALNLYGDPTDVLQAATKGYVDGALEVRRVGLSLNAAINPLTVANQRCLWATIAAEGPNDAALWSSTNRDRLLAPVAGVYQMDFTLRVDNLGGTAGVNRMAGEIVKNATDTRVCLLAHAISAGGTGASVATQTLTLRLAAGDYICLLVNSPAGTGVIQPGQTSSFLSWRYLGA